MGNVLRIVFTPVGRMNRTEFAVVFLGGLAVFIALVVAVVPFARSGGQFETWGDTLIFSVVGWIVLWKYTAVVAVVKRLHDMNASGMWWLLLFVPLVGLVLYLVAFFGGGTKGVNRYGSPSRFFEPRIRSADLPLQPA